MQQIPSHPNYAITPSGMVYSYRRKKFLRPSGIYLHLNLDGKVCYIHRMVAEVYIPKPVVGEYEINHKDKDKHNNNVGNLEWITKSENCYHRDDGSSPQARFNTYINNGVDPDTALYALTEKARA